ncbi:hypothetical protein P280DRAFT_471898 [Massarina eburnea CBS 473.64]|uniref:CFEM domain-containing protein n=1 Tax=Massarina eburnea CBS 473.64 TaxID=1395130 RepID=A0A6A6RQU1_9PLEO|nr:hypothetical protein P280DRAFT_471898 [Massarina eburnea CBS 473.64]
MRFSFPVVALFAASVLALDFSGAPACAQTCFIDSEGVADCDPNATEFTCFCADNNFYNAVYTCVRATCSQEDALVALAWHDTVCPS